jgi:glucose-6-phosphate 1-epimerase
VAFPQFAELGPLPVHGFAQFAQWQRRAGTECLTLVLRDSAATRTLWPHAFVAELTVHLAPGALDLGFAVHNPGRQTLQWSGALHTYLALDARGARLRGLGPGSYLDRADGSRRRHDGAVELRIPGHTDRAYLDAGTRVEVDDGQRRLAVCKTGFRDCVVWNPGPETTHRFDDLAPGDHAAFVCVEAAEVRPVPVAPGATWRGTQAIFAARAPTR